MNNLDFFKLLIENPENILDESYSGAKEKLVITKTKEENNSLIEANEKIIRLITTFQTLRENSEYDETNETIKGVLKKIIEVLAVNGMNYSAFSQYFLVQNISHSMFMSFNDEEKINIIYFLLEAYVEKRHKIYSSHGYSNIVLQVLCDNYSHKRKGKSGIEKIIEQINEITEFKHSTSFEGFTQSKFSYILPDKGDKNLFDEILENKSINFEFSDKKQGKTPDMLLKINNNFLIIEHKNMKENGGGQDKQISEILDFIRFSEASNNIHYVTYLDGIFSNKLFPKAKAKTLTQYNQVVEVLGLNPNNYFVNTFAFAALINLFVNGNANKN